MKVLGGILTFIGLVGSFFFYNEVSSQSFQELSSYGFAQELVSKYYTYLYISVAALILGIILLIVGSTKDKNERSIRENIRKSITCSNCQSSNDINWKICIGCGKELNESSTCSNCQSPTFERKIPINSHVVEVKTGKRFRVIKFDDKNNVYVCSSDNGTTYELFQVYEIELHMLPPSEQNEQNTKQCPYCGEKILTIAKKCKHCGEWFEEK